MGVRSTLSRRRGPILCSGTHSGDLSHGAPGNRRGREPAPEPYDQPFIYDAGKVSPALLERSPGCRDPGEFRDLSVVRFGILDDLALGVFECRSDVLKDHSMRL